MTSTGRVVRLGRMSRSYCVSLVDELNDLLLGGDEMFGESLNLDLLIFVFKNFEHSVVVEEIVDLATVDLVHRHCHCEVALVILPVVNASFEQILYRQVLQALHGECFSRPSLTVSEDGNGSSIENIVQDGLYTETVQVLCRLVLAERIIKLEVLVVDELRDAVHLILAVMHNRVRVGD